MKDSNRKPELLIPASNLEVLKTAVVFGADAVYIGGEAFGLRAKAKNFSKEDMAEGIRFAHSHGKKVYVTANILAHNRDLDGARAYFRELKEIGPDALIISDPGMFTLARQEWPEVEIHISTQANNTNYMTYRFWWEQGAKRVVSARELSLAEIREIRENIPKEMEIEALCMGPCAFLIPEDAFSAIISPDGMPIRGNVPIPAAGNMRSWKRAVRENIFRSMKMRGALLFSTPRICV